MKSIVFIGTMQHGSSYDAIQAAEELGYFTILLTDSVNLLQNRGKYKAIHYMEKCNLRNYELMKYKIEDLILKDFEIETIISFIEPFVHTACLLAHDFGLGRFSHDAILFMQNKVLSRQSLVKSDYAPWFKVINGEERVLEEDIKKSLPFVLKCPTSTGSKEVYMVYNLNEYKNLMSQYNKTEVIIEEYLEGPQYLVETLVIENEVKIIAVILQEIHVYNEHFIVTGYELLIEMDKTFMEDLEHAVKDIIHLHKMEQGACHLEMRLVNGKWKLIEINPRISGGAMNEFIKIGLGIDLVKETLKLATGQFVDITRKREKHAFLEYYVLSNSGIFIGVTGLDKVMMSKGVETVYIKPKLGSVVTPPKSLGNRYAYVIATGSSREEAKTNAKEAIKNLEFHLAYTDGWFWHAL